MKKEFFLLIVLLFPACSADPLDRSLPAENPMERDLEAIRDLMNRYVSGYQSEDVENFVEVFTEDAMRMQPNGPSIVGSEQIRTYYKDWFEETSLDVAVTPSEIKVASDWAVAWGTYSAKVTSKVNGEEKVDRGKFINVFKKGTDGAWRFHRNIWNSDLPLPESSP